MKPLLPLLLLTTLLLSACLSPSGSAPQTADGGTQTADGGLPTADYQTPASPTPTPTLTPTPTPAAVADFFDAGTFPPEMRQYVETLPSRNNLDPSEAEQKRYTEEDQKFHQFYMREMVAYLRKNGVDTSEFKGFKGEDWLDYQKSIKVYEALWRLLYQEYQETGEYRTDWMLTPWLLRGDGNENLGMYDQANFVFLPTDRNGNRQYRLFNREQRSVEYYMEKYNAETRQELIEKMLELYRLYGYNVPIYGINVNVPRHPVLDEAYGVLTAIVDMPGREGVKILVLGFVDENGKWVYQPFAVNLSPDTRTQAGDFMYTGGNVVPAPEGFIVRLAREGRLDEEGYNNEKLFALLGHEISLQPNNGFRDENNNTINFSQFMPNGIEGAGYIGGGGEAENSPLVEPAAGQGE